MINEEINLLCVIPTLGHGGAQKILTEVAHYVSLRSESETGVCTTVLTFRDNKNNFYRVKPGIKLRSIETIQGNSASFKSLLTAVIKLRKYLNANPTTVILSFQDIANFAVILSSLGTSNRIIVSERQDTRFYSNARLRRAIRNLLYRRAQAIVVQTKLVQEQFPPTLASKILVIPNHIEKHSLKSAPETPGRDGFFRAVAFGRLVDQKNFGLIINAAVHLKKYHETWKIDIYGSGELLDTHLAQIKAHSLQNFVTIYPQTTKVLKKMSEANLFLFPSLYEGFPNVLAEAVSCGLPPIGFEGVSGNSELIRNNFNGSLIQENNRCPKRFAEKIEYLMNQPKIRKTFGENCSQIISSYEREGLLKNWKSLIEYTANQ